jgi:ATP-dependent Clp protease ATP-binding subunit ClpB
VPFLNAAEDEAKKLKDDFVSVEHFVLAGVRQRRSGRVRIATGLRTTAPARLAEIRGRQRVTDQDPEGKFQALENTRATSQRSPSAQDRSSNWSRRENPPRDAVLSRRTKNNPVLIGEPGVGKTAIAEGIARRIANRRRSRIVEGEAHSRAVLSAMRGRFDIEASSRTA